MNIVYEWNAYDLDHILTEGERLYKSLGTLDLHSADELPRSVIMSNYNIPIDFLQLKTEIAHLRTGDTFLQRTVPNRHEEVMLLLFMGEFTTALIKQISTMKIKQIKVVITFICLILMVEMNKVRVLLVGLQYSVSCPYVFSYR